ncbi:AAA ATPase Elf1 [Brettanomyces nanus]|uniref:Transcription elongation factor 1 homolog n=1 Tax=Eeniella nana TaxID=13502 RepID=A0A875S004_EENNA|nr:AAA ATPase Elf1 [Brettanomyces nanus]QPG75111.1 AAA ATPase Elf1 [Brettanomyces nanus]
MVMKKIKQKLDTQFTCLFCNHEKSVTCTMDKKSNVATLLCKVCGQSFQSPINSLSEPVDIYSDWVDACEAVAEEEAKLVENGKSLLDAGDGDVDGDEDEDVKAKDEDDY